MCKTLGCLAKADCKENPWHNETALKSENTENSKRQSIMVVSIWRVGRDGSLVWLHVVDVWILDPADNIFAPT